MASAVIPCNSIISQKSIFKGLAFTNAGRRHTTSTDFPFQESKTPPTFSKFSCKFRSIGNSCKSQPCLPILCAVQKRLWSCNLMYSLLNCFTWSTFPYVSSLFMILCILWSFSWGSVVVCTCYDWRCALTAHWPHSLESFSPCPQFFKLIIKKEASYVFTQRLSRMGV